MDVMIFPSLYESFRGIIIWNGHYYVYATPEIVQNNYNGKLLHHPIFKPTILNGNCVDTIIQDRYLKHDEFYYGMYEVLLLKQIVTIKFGKKIVHNYLNVNFLQRFG